MPPRHGVFLQGQTATGRMMLCCGCVGLSCLALIGFSLLQRMHARENGLDKHPATVAPGEVQSRLAPALPSYAGAAAERPYSPNYGKLPLSFEVNQGQTDAQVRFLARGRGYRLFLTGDEAVLSLKKSGVRSQGLEGRRSEFEIGNSRLENRKPRIGGRQSAIGTRQSTIEAATGIPGLLISGLETAMTGSQSLAASPQSPAPSVLRVGLEGANPRAVVSGQEELPGKANYFIGNDPKKWRANVPTYAKVRYENVYPGVDLVYYGNQAGELECDFVVAPSGDPSSILLAVDGRRQVGSKQKAVGSSHSKIDSNGDLVVYRDANDEVRFHKPVVYQEQGSGFGIQDSKARNKTRGSSNRQSTLGNRQFIEGRFVLDAWNLVRFAVGPYDHARPLVIDPELVYSTYLGGSISDSGYGIAVDAFGYVYLTGNTGSADFPTINPLQATNHASPNPNVFVAKLNAAGSALVYSTYLGGSGSSQAGANSGDYGYGIAVDSSGNAYVTGTTTSVDFPTFNAFQPAGSPQTAFVTKLSATGSALVYSTYLGGSRVDDGRAIAVDPAGDAYVTGETSSNDFPTVNPIQATCGGGCGGGAYYDYDAFVAKFNAAGSALVYSTFLGGSEADEGYGIAVDSSGNAYVAGSTGSADFPTVNAFQPTCGGDCADGRAFVAKLNPAGSALVYSTFLGGSSNGGSAAAGIAVDSFANAYVAGGTLQNDFPTANPLQATCGGGCKGGNAFVTKLNVAGSTLVYSTYLGGSNNEAPDAASGIAVDAFGNAYVTGTAASSDFPTSNPVQATLRGQYDAFLAKLNPAGSALVYSTYLGGDGWDFGGGIAVDSTGNAYVTGQTNSINFPTVNPLQAANHAEVLTAFVAKMSASGAAPSASCSPESLTFAAQNVDTASPPQTVTVINTGTASLTLSAVTVGGANASDFATSAETCAGATVTPDGTCAVSVTFTPSATGNRRASLIFTDNATSSPQTLSLTGIGGTAPAVAAASPASLTFSREGLGTMSAAQWVTLSNTGEATLTITSIAISDNFSQTNNCGGSVAGDGSCSIDVTFSPTSTGAFKGTLTITDNSNGAAGSTQSVALSGTGQDFTLAVAAGSSSSATVVAGQTATYTLSVSPAQGGFNQSVSFTCTPPPDYTTCAISPNSVTLGNSATNVTVTVTTKAASMGPPRFRPLPPAPHPSPSLRVLLMLALVLVGTAWAVALRESCGTSRRRFSIVPLAAGLLLALALTGCGGGGSGGGPPCCTTATAPGTYTVTVTGTAGLGSSALSHSLALTLIVS